MMDKNTLMPDDDIGEADKNNDDNKKALQDEIITLIKTLPKDKIILLEKMTKILQDSSI